MLYIRFGPLSPRCIQHHDLALDVTLVALSVGFILKSDWPGLVIQSSEEEVMGTSSMEDICKDNPPHY